MPNNTSSIGTENNSMPLDDVSFDNTQDNNLEIGNDVNSENNEDDINNMPEDNMINNNNLEDDSTMKIISQLSDKDKKTVEAYAESLLSNDKEEENNDEMVPDGLNMEGPMNETFIFSKKQLNKLMENFGPTNDELDNKKNTSLKIEKNNIKNTPFNSPKFE